MDLGDATVANHLQTEKEIDKKDLCHLEGIRGGDHPNEDYIMEHQRAGNRSKNIRGVKKIQSRYYYVTGE